MPTHTLGPAGYAAAIHHLITDCLTSRLGQPPPRLRAVLDAALHQLRIVAGEDYDPEQYPGDGLLDARGMLLAAEVLIIEADRLAAPGLECDGELTSRFVGLRAYLDERIEAAEAKATADR